MTAHATGIINNRIGFITLNRAKALNALSLDMIRVITTLLRDWQHDDSVIAVVIRASSERAFCAGGDIRFFYQVGTASPAGGSALLEDFFTEEYALNHLIHHYSKPYIAFMDGIVMGGGMGVSQGGASRVRIVTEKTAMAMPEVHIGLFPDVGGSYFLSRAPGRLGDWLALTGQTIGAADALYADLADVALPAATLPELLSVLESQPFASGADVTALIRAYAIPYAVEFKPEAGMLAMNRKAIERHFAHNNMKAIVASLEGDDSEFSRKTLAYLQRGSPLLLCVTLEQLRRGAGMTVAECLRMERTMVRHSFEGAEVLEGIRARVIEKDNAPQWSPATLDEVSKEQVEQFFSPAWPAHAHPLREL